MTPAEMDALELRVANGITWLDQHDPGSRFHTWWQAGLTPSSPLPAHEATPEVKTEWAEYFRRRQLFEQLDARLSAAQERARTHPPTVLPWKPKPDRL